MATVFTSNLRLALPTTGAESGTWGDTVNNSITTLVDTAITGLASLSMTTADYTLSTANGATDEARCMFLTIGGTPGAARSIIVPALSKLYIVYNNSTGGYAQTVKTSAGTGISVPNGSRAVLYCDGTNVVTAATYASAMTLGTALPVASGGTGASTLTANYVLLGNGTSAPQMIAPGTAKNVLMSDGTTWAATSLPGITITWTGTHTFTNSLLKLLGSSTGVTTFTSANAGASNYTITFPAATATVATLDGIQTLTNKTLTYADNTLTGVQPTLVSGTSIKTVNSNSLLGSGDVAVQATLVSGTNIKTVNSNSLLGSGDLTVATGAWVLLGTATPTAAANLDAFLSTFSSTYDSYMIIAEGLVPNGSDSLSMRFATGGSVDTGSVYFTPGESLTTGAVSSLSVGPTFYVSGQGGTCEITVQNANDTVRMKTGFARCVAETTAGQVRFQSSGIAYNAANAISGFRLYWAGGANFTAVGKVRVYGIVNA